MVVRAESELLRFARLENDRVDEPGDPNWVGVVPNLVDELPLLIRERASSTGALAAASAT
jgi:hypothetical protein